MPPKARAKAAPASAEAAAPAPTAAAPAAAEAAPDAAAPAASAAPSDAARGNTAGYAIFTTADSARTKGMWAGALERTEIAGLTGAYLPAAEPPADAPADAPTGAPAEADGAAPAEAANAPAEAEGAAPAAKSGAGGGSAQAAYELREIRRAHTPALLKIVDEGLVNASDHKKEHEGARRAAERVTRIALKFDPASGQIVIENDGPGLPAVLHEKATAGAGHPVYVPEVAFAYFLAGRNMEKPPDSVKGGINGIGGKLINVHSASFVVETVGPGADGAPTFYVQAFRDRMRAREAPRVFPVAGPEGRKLAAERRRPHTRITFVPAYAELGYPLGPGGRLAADDAADLEAWCRWRMCLLAAYVGPAVETTFNGARCGTTSARALAALAVAREPGAVIFDCPLRAAEPPQKGHPWEVAVAVVPGGRRFEHLSVINGVHTAGGSHAAYLRKLLGAAVGERLAKATKATKRPPPADACKHLFVAAVGALPGADWGGQRKDELQVAEAKLRPYAFAPGALAKVAAAAAEAALLEEAEKSSAKGKKKKLAVEKYTGARRAGTKDSAACSLLAAEGDSAIALLRAGLTLGAANPGGPTFEHYGIFSLGGVIMNALKQVSEIETARGDTALVRSEQLRNNKTLANLAEVLGLDYACRYETDAEVARLRYGALVVATDQDLDGTGKILPLVLVWFNVFWPRLLARGFVKRYVTPVIRAKPAAKRGGPPLEFFYEDEFARWAAEVGPEGQKAYRVKYYKGLATHDESEVAEMFRRFHENVYTFAYDAATAGPLFRTYFGPSAAARKAELVSPVRFLGPEETAAIRAARRVDCCTQLSVDAKAYKLDDIERKIPGAADGLPVARRKVLAGAFSCFAASNKEVKVFQLGGYVAQHMFYHHGDASLNGTIISMAQRFPGALAFPYIAGVGQFGSRHLGGADAGSPRYISVRLAAPYARAVLPAEDTCLLPHAREDGERAQPQYYVGVLPTALLESFEIPSEGWRHKSFARDLDDVVRLVRAYVAGEPLVARAAAAVEAAPPGTPLERALPPADAAAFRGAYPLRVSLRGYGEHLAPAERAQLVRTYRGREYSFGWYAVAPERDRRGATTVRVVELPLRKTTEAFLKELEKESRARYIDDVANYSSAARVDVRIRLRPGAWEEITGDQSPFGGAEIDPVEDFLLLRASLQPFLNYYSADRRVLEFGEDYHAVFFYWVALRRDLYRRRFERELVLVGLRARLEAEALRFIAAAREIDLARVADEDAAAAALEGRGFPRLDAGLLREPGHTPTEELEALVTAGPHVSFAYLLNLYERDLVRAAAARREERLAALEARRAELEELLRSERPFPGAAAWAAEVDKVVAAIALGEKLNWWRTA
jgi:DNA topoisomerase II